MVDGGARFRFRLYGTSLVDHAGFDQTGLHVDELPRINAYRDYVNGLYRDLLAAWCPLYTESDFNWNANVVYRTQRLMMPLSSTGTAIDRVFSVQTFTGDRRPRGDTPESEFNETVRQRIEPAMVVPAAQG